MLRTCSGGARAASSLSLLGVEQRAARRGEARAHGLDTSGAGPDREDAVHDTLTQDVLSSGDGAGCQLGTGQKKSEIKAKSQKNSSTILYRHLLMPTP